MDRLQPLLHNFFTGGGTWHTPGVTSDDVLARKSPISHASDMLWETARRIIEEGVERGFLKEKQDIAPQGGPPAGRNTETI